MNRRRFLGALGAAAFGPWVVTHAGVLMPIRQTPLTPPLQTGWVRCTMDVDCGEVSFFTSPDARVWTKLGASIARKNVGMNEGGFAFSVDKDGRLKLVTHTGPWTAEAVWSTAPVPAVGELLPAPIISRRQYKKLAGAAGNYAATPKIVDGITGDLDLIVKIGD